MHSIWFQKKDIIEWRWERWSISADLMNQLFSVWLFFRMYKSWLLKPRALDIILVFTMDRLPVHPSHLGAILGLQSTLCSVLLLDCGRKAEHPERKTTLARQDLANSRSWNQSQNLLGQLCPFSLEEQACAPNEWSYLSESFKKSQQNYKTSIFITYINYTNVVYFKHANIFKESSP